MRRHRAVSDDAAMNAQSEFRPGGGRVAVAGIATAAAVLELAVSGRYGYHRDELYFLAAGQHPAFGYVDQPPLAPMLARLGSDLFGNTPVGLRVVPALCLAALVLMTASMGRLLGAGRTGQILAALATATCAEYLGAMHLLTTTAPDFVFWSLTLLLVLRLLVSRDPRWWLAIGAGTGVAAEAKWNIGFLAGCLALGFAVTPARRLLANRWFAIAVLLAAALAAPSVAWQAANGWPMLDVAAGLQLAAGHNRAVYWPAQVVYTGAALAPLWIAGLIWGFRNQAARPFRPVVIACAAAIGWFFIAGGKPYYPGAVYTFLFAAGSVPLERWLARRARHRPAGHPWRRPAVLAGTAMVASALLALPIALPILPAPVLSRVPLQKINYDLAETIGWPRFVDVLALKYRSLPPAIRSRTVILTGNYGEAGAVTRLGPAGGLPPAFSGANNFWLWGPPPARDTSVLAVNVNPALLRKEFTRVQLIGVFWNGIGVRDDEQGAVIYLAIGLRSSWTRAWPEFRDYS